MTKQIASIYFEELKAERPLYQGVFRIAAVAKGGAPVLLTIHDHIQREKMPNAMGGGQRRDTVLGEEIAQDLFKYWAANSIGMAGDCGPGIWVVRDSVPVLDADGVPVFDLDKRPVTRPATDEEKKSMWAEDLAAANDRQDRWANTEFIRADAMYSEAKENVRWIGPTPRLAATYLGLKPEWLNQKRAADSRNCPFCGESMLANVPVCKGCNNVVDQKRYAELKKSQSAA